MTDIINRVTESGLITIDLENYSSKEEIIEIDITDQLWEGLVLKEQDFRNWIKDNDWNKFKGKQVYINCSADAIVPTWTYMISASSLSDIALNYVVGSKLDLEKQIIQKNISSIDLENLRDKRVVIKGCASIAAPNFAMVELVKYIQPVVKSIMFGEPCSTVPVFKRKK